MIKRLTQAAALLIGVSVLMLRPAYPESIPLKLEGGTYVVPVLINGKLTLNFTLDSGAADVSIPVDVFGTLRRTGTISYADLLAPREYVQADGSVSSAPTFLIRTLKVGNVEVHNVVASVSPMQGNLLLGQSFLSRVRTWSVDNQRHVLVLGEGIASDSHPVERSVTSLPAQPRVSEAGAADSPPPADWVVEEGQSAVTELRKPEYRRSRCMLTPVLAGDGITVAFSTDRTFASGDIILSVGTDRLDPSVKTPLRDVLVKHGPTELVSVKVRRSGAELTVTAACKDSRPFYDAAFEAGLAASKGDAATCYDKMVEAGRLEALHSRFLNLEFDCGMQAGRIVTPGDIANSYYEIGRRMILENAWSADALGGIRATILTGVDTLKKNNAGYLGDDLKSQYDQAVAASSRAK